MSYANKESIHQAVCSIIANIIKKPELGNRFDESQPVHDVGIDSMLLIHLIVQIEAEFNIAFPDDELLQENFGTVGTITDNIMKKLGVLS